MTKTALHRGKRTVKSSDRQLRQRDLILWILTLSFLLGAVLGGILAGKLGAEGYALRFLKDSMEGIVKPSFWREAWITLRWPVGVLLLRILPCSILTIPGLFFLRGFFLSYGITALSLGLGAIGTLCAALVYGALCLLTVPVMFVLGTAGLAGKESRSWLSPEQAGLCLGALALSILLGQTVVPLALSCFLRLLA